VGGAPPDVRGVPGRRRLFATATLAGAILWTAACASSGPKPGVGDISFRLAWEGEADLDLYVFSPLGEQIDFLHREVASGGLLDVDCNVTVLEPAPLPSGQSTLVPRKLRCPRPLENVYWPRGDAPAGTYGIQVLLADGAGALASDAFALEVRFGRDVVTRFEGEVGALASEPLRRQIAYPGRR